MATARKLVFVNDAYYHVFNRGIDRRVTFGNKREYTRVKDLLYFYQFAKIPIRFSRFTQLPPDQQQECLRLMVQSGNIVDIIAYCLMPNHFHLLLRQKKDKGIATFTANVINAYTKYFNTKHERTGPLFQGVFKAVYVETTEQLLHLTRYIHLNPVASSLITTEQLQTYPWSSYQAFLSQNGDILVERESLIPIVSAVANYEEFVTDQVEYSKELEKIKHRTFEEKV